MEVEYMTNDQKLELGIEIVSAMKASAYDVSIEEGRIMALENTELDRMEELYSLEELSESVKGEKMEFYKKWTSREKELLHKQAMFVADIAVKKIKGFDL